MFHAFLVVPFIVEFLRFWKGTILVGTYIGLIFVGERFFGLFICPTGTRYALWETF